MAAQLIWLSRPCFLKWNKVGRIRFYLISDFAHKLRFLPLQREMRRQMSQLFVTPFQVWAIRPKTVTIQQEVVNEIPSVLPNLIVSMKLSQTQIDGLVKARRDFITRCNQLAEERASISAKLKTVHFQLPISLKLVNFRFLQQACLRKIRWRKLRTLLRAVDCVLSHHQTAWIEMQILTILLWQISSDREGSRSPSSLYNGIASRPISQKLAWMHA